MADIFLSHLGSFFEHYQGVWVISQITLVLTESCYVGPGYKYCDHGCCNYDCCSEEPFWSRYWYLLLLLGGVSLIFTLCVLVMLLVDYSEQNRMSRTLQPVRRVEPVRDSRLQILPNSDQTRSPPSSERRPPPKYDTSQSAIPVLPSYIPETQTSTGRPTRTTSMPRRV